MSTTLSNAARKSEPSVLDIGNVSLNVRNYQTTIDGQPIELTYQEFELLRLLISELDRVLSYDAISEKLFGITGHAANRRLNVMVHRLRTKLREMQPYEIRTVRGRGYGLVRLWSEEGR